LGNGDNLLPGDGWDIIFGVEIVIVMPIVKGVVHSTIFSFPNF